MVPPELDGALAIPEFSVLRLREDCDRDYVVEILRSPCFLELMTIYSTGEMSGRISEKDLRRLRIPLPEDHHQLGATLREQHRRMESLRRQIAACEQTIAELCLRVVEGQEDSSESPRTLALDSVSLATATLHDAPTQEG